MDGILLVEKPSGLTSHDVVDFIRNRFKLDKVGHAGTLDPDATGVLVLLLGKATKLFSKISSHDKQYLAVVKLGESTDTMDSKGKITDAVSDFSVNEKDIKEVLKEFEGEIAQVPPMFSAVKLKGRKLYELARQGKTVPRKPRKIYIHKIDMVKFTSPFIKLRIKCSKGTYTRKICNDLGSKLGIPAHQFSLVREKCGDFNLSDAVSINKLKALSKNELKVLIIQPASIGCN